MLKKLNIILIIFLLFFQISINKIKNEKTKEPKLIFVYEHMRHGARGPPFDSNSNFTDEYGTKWFGDGDLTNIGKRMHYILGIRNRKKYSSLININKFNPKEILIKSTNSNRTIQSVLSQLYGIYLPGIGDKLNNDKEIEFAYPPNKKYLSYDVIKEVNQLGNFSLINGIEIFPIHPFENGKLFLNEISECPNMKKIKENLIKKSNITIIYDKINKEFGNELKNYFNYSDTNFIYDFNKIISITDNFICNYIHNKNLDDFLNKTKINKDKFYNISIELHTAFLYQNQCDLEICTMTASPLMEDLLIYISNRIKYQNEENYKYPKFVIHSGHDTTLSPIEYFMFGVFGTQYKYIDFASNVLFEVYKSENYSSGYFVKYIIDDEEVLNIDFEEFKSKINKSIWSKEKINNFCGINTSKFSTLSIIIIIILSIFSLIMIGINVVLCYKIKKKKEILFEPLN